jgi:ABC-type antimicrobial peptide transport system permease subunit
VGVVGRVKQYGLDTDGRIVVYLPQTQAPARAMYMVVRADGAADRLGPAVRDVVRAVDPALPIYRMRTLQTLVDNSVARQRFALQLLGLFAVVALALAAIGTYGVMSYIVAQGRRELGIRLALGATARGIVGLVVTHGLWVAALGIAAGLLGAVAVSRVMSTLLFGVPPTDPVTYAAAAALLGAVAFAAVLIPAIRASAVDPVTVLRSEQ